MKKGTNNNINDYDILDSHVGCFGNFLINDSICIKHCVLSISCTIEQNKNNNLEMLDGLFLSDMMMQ